MAQERRDVMLRRISILGGDLRQRWLAEELRQCGFEVAVYQVPELENTFSSLQQTVKSAQALALPMPALTKDGWIRADPQPLPLIPVLESLRPGTFVFGGPFTSAAETLAQYPVQLSDYTLSPALAAGNAVPTAEGAIQLAMERLPITLSGSRCLVIGFGKIGKALSLRLRGLCAEVTVSARRPEDCALAEALGLQSDRTGVYFRGLRQYDCVFNTVPASVLLEEHIAALRPDCLIVDLASAPGGLAPGLTPPERPVYLTAPGLPGRVAPASAATLLKEHILRTLTP